MGLLLLSLITIIVAAAITSGMLQLRMTRNTVYATAAFQAAEDASNIILYQLSNNQGCTKGDTKLIQLITNGNQPTCTGTLVAPPGIDKPMYLSWSAEASLPDKQSNGLMSFIFTITARACRDAVNGKDCAVSVREQGYQKNY